MKQIIVIQNKVHFQGSKKLEPLGMREPLELTVSDNPLLIGQNVIQDNMQLDILYKEHEIFCQTVNNTQIIGHLDLYQKKKSVCQMIIGHIVQ
jgi:hypothetical protein